jgi:hypothetical protein
VRVPALASPLALRGRRLPALPERVLAAAVTPALAGLVLFQLCGSGRVDARAGGVAAGAVVFVRRRSFLLALVAAAGVTALLRHA